MHFPLITHRLRTLLRTLGVIALSVPMGALAQTVTASIPVSATCPNGLKLLEPLPNGQTVICPSGNPFGVINTYLRPMLEFMVAVAAGLAVLMIVLGGLQIIMSNGDQGKIGEGKQRITGALLGLLLLVFSATVLNFLNAYFFKLQ